MAIFKNKWVWLAVAVVAVAMIEWKTKFFTAQYNKLVSGMAPKATLPGNQ